MPRRWQGVDRVQERHWEVEEWSGGDLPAGGSAGPGPGLRTPSPTPVAGGHNRLVAGARPVWPWPGRPAHCAHPHRPRTLPVVSASPATVSPPPLRTWAQARG